MKAQQFLVTSLTSLAIAGMVFGPAVPPALAQVAPPGPGAAQPAGPEVNPNEQVGRLAWMQGSVSFHTEDQDSWGPASVNYPVSAGDGLWTEPGALAGIEVANTLIALAGGTELDVAQMADQAYAFTVPQGELYVHVRSVQPGESYTIATPRGTVTIGTPGQYEIAAGTTQDPTVVTVLAGAAQISGAAQGNVAAGQAAVITGDQAFQMQMVAAQRDAFLNEMLSREQPAATASGAAPEVPVLVQQMPGGDDLSAYGSWSSAPEYGQVWYPQVAAGWQPYTDGHWAWVQPYGWTWVDNDPWGFAPFHYGRWVQIGGRWGWCPASVQAAGPAYPVYAPALVAFFGIGAAFAAGAAVGALWSSGRVGWVPLGPGEAYHPWFRASPTYLRNVNIRQVTNVANITNVNNVTINNFRNARAAVVVPAAAMATSRPIQGVARAADPAALREARPVMGRSPLPPTTATAGITPAVARQVHAVAAPAGYAVPARAAAPGPAIQRVAVQGGRPVAPALRTATPAAAVGAARPGIAPGARPETPAVAGHALPALRAPEAAHAGPPTITHGAAEAAIRPPAGGIRPGAVTPEPRTQAAARPLVPQAGARPEGTPRPAEVPGARTEATVRPAAPHVEARPAVPEVRAATPPVVHAAPEAHAAVVPHVAPAPRPAPEVHAVAPAPRPAPRPAPVEHVAAPPPRPAPAPRPAPEVHAAAAPHQAPEGHEKKPGER